MNLISGRVRRTIHAINLETYGISSKKFNHNSYSSSVYPACPGLTLRGSTFADYVLSYFIFPDPINTTPPLNSPSFFPFLQSLEIQAATFQELTTTNMKNFNRYVLDRSDIRYFSFGASFNPTWGSVFRTSHDIIAKDEGLNDGLVSVSSAVWGEYKGTLQIVNYSDIINWVSQLVLFAERLIG
jgi:triacylglycerol lipase